MARIRQATKLRSPVPVISGSGTVAPPGGGAQTGSGALTGIRPTIAGTGFVNQTALEALVNSLNPGQWGVLNSGSALNALWNGGGAPDSSSIFEFAWRMVWDSELKQALFYGGDDNGSGTNNPKFVRYREALNTWDQLANPFFRFTNSPQHSYGHNVIDVPNRRMYWHQMGYNDDSWYSVDLDNLPGGWVSRANINNGVHSVDGAVAFAEFPARGTIVLCSGDVSFNLREYSPSGNSWTASLYSAGGNGGLHVFCEYSGAYISGQAANGCIIFGGGFGVNTIRRLNPDGTVTNLTGWPFTSSFDARFGEIIRDPVTENLLFIYDNGTQRVFAELNPRGSGTWTQLASGTNSIPPFDSGWEDVHSTFHTVACSVVNHGCIMVCQWRPSGSRAMIYKHAASTTMRQLIVEDLAGNTDTLTALDFENRGRYQDIAFISGQGDGVQITNTTDPGTAPNRLIRDHPNFGQLDSGGFLIQATLDEQGSPSPWNSQGHTFNQGVNSGPILTPRIQSNEGEFYQVRGSGSCLRLSTPGPNTQKASGDFVVPFRRNQAPWTAGPYTFWVAGAGAEIWIRYALRHSIEALTLNLTPDSGFKRSIISGDSSSQTLEETIQDTFQDRLWNVYSDSGSEPYPDTTRAFIADWTVVHLRIIVAQPPNYNNGTVQLFLNDETAPIISVTNAQMDTGSALLSGWQTAVNTGITPNGGYWKAWLTNFYTNKSETQAHAIVVMDYDNVVIRRNTRCPHIRSG